jgi:hypothetical protein
MEKVVQSRNLLFKLIQYSSEKDVFNAGGACRLTRQAIRQRDDLWKDVVCHFYPNELWAEINIDVADYLLIAINKEPIRDQLMRLYVLYRLQQPISTPKGLAIYLQIKTPTLPAPWDKTILIGELSYDDERKAHRLIFRKKDKSSFYIWHGEQGHRSETFFYMLNRAKKGSFNPDDCKVDLGWDIQKSKTILRDSQKEEISRLLKLDLWKEQSSTQPEGGNNPNNTFIGNRGNLFYNAFVSSSQQQRPYDIISYTEWVVYPRFRQLFEQITGKLLLEDVKEEVE